MPDMQVINDKNTTHLYPIAASQTILPDQPVRLNSSGLLELAAADSVDLLGTSMGKWTSLAAGTLVSVYDDPDAEFEIKADNAAQALRATNGDFCDLVISSSVFYANLDATSTKVLKVVNGLAADFDPLMDGTQITGSALAGNFTPPWNSKARIRVKIALHQKANQATDATS